MWRDLTARMDVEARPGDGLGRSTADSRCPAFGRELIDVGHQRHPVAEAA